jgi:DNA-binding phage protein
MSKKLKNNQIKGRYLTQALLKDEPEEIQLMFQDVIRASGGILKVSRKAGVSEWRLRLMLQDSEEGWKLKRLQEVCQAIGLQLVVLPQNSIHFKSRSKNGYRIE